MTAAIETAAGGSIRIERGVIADHRELAAFHYRGAHPGLVIDVWRAVTPRSHVKERFGWLGESGHVRFVGQSAPDSSHRSWSADGGLWKKSVVLNPKSPIQNPKSATKRGLLDEREATCSGGFEVIGVLVVARPRLSCRFRERATGDRYRSLGSREGAKLVNREVRTISRVIVEPRHRGTGVATALVRRVLLEHERQGVAITEAIASMGVVSPFFERAGMRQVELGRRAEHQRLVDAFERSGLTLASLMADDRSLQAAWAGLACGTRVMLEAELRLWFAAAHRAAKAKREAMGAMELLDLARREAWAAPAYFVKMHGRKASKHEAESTKACDVASMPS